MERKRIGYYDYTVVLTYCGMLLAFTGVLMSINGKLVKSIVWFGYNQPLVLILSIAFSKEAGSIL